MWTSFFPSRAAAWIRHSGRRARRRGATLRAARLAGWETLGLGLGQEALEQRSMLAADLVLSFDDNIAAQVDKTFYTAGSQVVYKLTVENKGDAAATNAVVTTTLSSKIDAARTAWFASYTGGGTGNPGGGGNVNTPVTLPAGGKVVFQITGTVKADATGDLVSVADVAVTPGASNSRTDIDRFVPRSIVVSDGLGFSGSSRVQLVDPTTGAAITPVVSAFRPELKTGVRTAVGDLNADGKDEILVVPNYGTTATIEVFRQSVANDGKVTLVRDAARSGLMPFGPGYGRGLSVAVGDFDRDGRADVAVAKAIGSGDVKVFRSTTSATEPFAALASFTPFPEGKSGARLATGDFGTFSGTTVLDAGRGDGKAELAVASGAGMAPTVKVYNVSGGSAAVVRTIRPFTNAFRGGVDLAVGRVNADSIPDLLLAQRTGGTSQVHVVNGRVDTPAAAAVIATFAAFGDQVATRSAAVALAGVETGDDGLVKAINVVQDNLPGAAMRRLSTSGTRLGIVAAVAGSKELASGLSAADTVKMTTASGLKLTWLTTPTGTARPTDTSSVNVDYSGYLAKDGTNFDSGRGSTFRVNEVIKGFTETLKLMKVGEAVKVEIPAALAYGSAGSPPKIPANADLIFYIRLNSIS